MDKNKYISEKIRKLMHEGKSQAQSIAIAYSMYEQKHKMQDGGEVQQSKASRYMSGKELSFPIIKVEPVVENGIEGYRQYYTDPKDPNADYSFLSKEDYLRKKEMKRQGFLDYEPYLQAYLKKTGGREGIQVKYEEGGELPKYQQGSITPFAVNDPLNPYAGVFQPNNPIPLTNNRFSIGELSPWNIAPMQTSPTQSQNKNVVNFFGRNVPMSTIQNQNAGVTPQQQQNTMPTQITPTTQTPQVSNSSDAFYRGLFQNNPFGAPSVESNIGFTQNIGFGYDPNYTNQLSTESLRAGEGFAERNPLPRGVFSERSGLAPEQGERDTRYNDFVKYNILNPYGGVDPMAGLTYGLYNLGAGEGSRATLGLSRFGVGALRQGLSAYGAGVSDRQARNQYMDRQFNSPPIYEYKEGGEVTVGDMLTGNYIAETPNPTVEIEQGEYVKNSETNAVQEAVGKKHKEGGVKTNLPAGSKVLSDHTKIGKENVKKFNELYEIKVKATDTFSDVMDKYKKKIGAVEIEEEEVEILNMLEKQLKSNISEKTKQINLDFLSKELEELQGKKTEIQKQQEEAFEVLFNEQEKIPKTGKIAGMQEGGEVSPEIMQIAEQYGIAPDKVMELLASQQQTPQEEGIDVMQQVMGMLQQGASPEQVVQELIAVGYPQEEAVSMVEQVVQQQAPLNEEGLPMAQEGLYTFSTQYTPKVVGYDVNGRAILDTGTLSGVEAIQPYTGQGYGAKMSDVQKTIDLHSWYFDTDEKKKAFIEASKKEGEQPEIKAFQEAYNKEIKDRAKKAGVSETEAENIIKEVGFTGSGVQKFDGKFGAFTSSRPLFDFTKKDGQTQAIVTEPTPTTINQASTPTENVVNRQVTRNVVPLLPYTPIMPPSAMLIPKRQQIDLSRIEPMKIGVEPNLAEAERVRLARAQSYSNLSPEVAAVMQSTDLASTQQAANQAISTAEVANAQAQFQADQFNAQQRDREQLTNLGLDKQYEREMFATIANQERDWMSYYNALNRQQRADYQTIEEVNLLNAMTPNYQYVPGQGTQFVNPYMFSNRNVYDVQAKQLEDELKNAKTPQERTAIQERQRQYMMSKNA